MFAEEAPHFTVKAHQHGSPTHNNQLMLSITGRLRVTSESLESSTAKQKGHAKFTSDKSVVEAAKKTQKDLQDSIKGGPQGLGIDNPTVVPKLHAAKDSITMPGAFQ